MSEAIRKYFLANDLPWTNRIEKSLLDDECNSVEDLKLLEEDEWEELFADRGKVTQRKAKLVFQELRKEEYNPSRCTKVEVAGNTMDRDDGRTIPSDVESDDGESDEEESHHREDDCVAVESSSESESDVEVVEVAKPRRRSGGKRRQRKMNEFPKKPRPKTL